MTKDKKAFVSSSHQKLGDYKLHQKKFEGIQKFISEFRSSEVAGLSERQKIHFLSSSLLTFIKEAEEPCFLLPAVLSFIDEVGKSQVVELYNFSIFELWLNQFSGLSAEENYHIRAKIVGKYIPRDEYQGLFPIGMKKVHHGTHFVTAHGSPDLDTTVASFWGWVDAFGARVSAGLHRWNVPEGSSASEVEKDLLFYEVFGKQVFESLAKSKSALSLTAIDLMTQKGVIKKTLQENAFTIDHSKNQQAVILVDEKGYYVGDWLLLDVEGITQVINLLNGALRWFENNLHTHFITLFAQKDLKAQDLVKEIQDLLERPISSCGPFSEFTAHQLQLVEKYLSKVLGVSKGLDGSIKDLAIGLKQQGVCELHDFVEVMGSLQHAALFDGKGDLVENRSTIFGYLQNVIHGLDKAIYRLRQHVERLDIALKIKVEVFGYKPNIIGHKADLEEIKVKMENHAYLTVVYPDSMGRLVPMGIVQASDLYKTPLATVTLRDFCNREETKVPSYFDVISVIDHHKSVLSNASPSTVLLSDAQSANTLLAERAFEINDRYSVGGMSASAMQRQIESLHKDCKTNTKRRTLSRLLAKEAVNETKDGYYIAPEREILEYLHFLYAIMDDTDLLTKISYRDVVVVAFLLNRLKSLTTQEEVEIIHFDDIAKDEHFVKKAAQRILQNEDMYSLYKKTYSFKEKAVEDNVLACAQGNAQAFFVDTKTQNGCAKVGQTKIFASNYKVFEKNRKAIRDVWLQGAVEFYKDHTDIDFHLHMISTINGADELFHGDKTEFAHKDELWIWVPHNDEGISHLKGFLDNFKNIPQVVHNQMEVELIGKGAKDFEWVFKENFSKVPIQCHNAGNSKETLIVMHYKAGSLNSRKAVISPCLPKLAV